MSRGAPPLCPQAVGALLMSLFCRNMSSGKMFSEILIYNQNLNDAQKTCQIKLLLG